MDIVMSNRRPVTIDPEQWHVIARAKWHNGEHEFQANYVRTITVREHADGRRIVYGVHERGNGGAPASFRGSAAGYVVTPRDGGEPDDNETVAAIRRVAEAIGDPGLAGECVADLPAETI